MIERMLKTALGILLFAGGVSLCGCENRSVTVPEEEGELTMMANAMYVVSEQDSISLIEAVDSLLVFDITGTIRPIPKGSVIIGTENEGYIRRVISTAIHGRRLSVRTRPAFLTDVVILGRVDTTLALGFASSAAQESAQGKERCADPVHAAFGGMLREGQSRFDRAQTLTGVSESEDGLDLAGVVLYSGEEGGSDLSVTIPQGRIEFDPELDLFAAIRLSRFAEFRAIAEGMLHLDCDVQVQTSGPLDIAREVPIASLDKMVIQYIRFLPVVEVIRLSFVAAFSIHSNFIGTCGMGIESAGLVKFGPRFEAGAWSYVAESTPVFTPHAIHYESGEDADIRISIEPRIDVEFYGLPCASSAFGPYFGLVEQNAGFPVLEWEIFAGMSGEMAFRSGALARESLGYDAAPLCCRTTLDSGPFRTGAYIFIAQWGSAGAGDGQFGYPSGIAVDKEGSVYVVDNLNNNVQKFSASGAFLLKWGTSGNGDGQFDSPEKIAVDDSGYVYVVDGGNDRVQKFSPNGAFMAKWGSEGIGDCQFRSPEGIAISGGRVFVADNVNNRVQKLAANGDFLAAWGSYGSGDGQFDGPMGVAVNADEGTVFVSDCHNSRIQKFSIDGQFLASWGSSGSGDGQFDCPVDVAIGPGGIVLVTDIGNDRIAQFTSGGVFMTKLGSMGTQPGQFDHPAGVAVDAQGNLYVLDARNARVEVFAPRAGGAPMPAK